MPCDTDLMTNELPKATTAYHAPFPTNSIGQSTETGRHQRAAICGAMNALHRDRQSSRGCSERTIIHRVPQVLLKRRWSQRFSVQQSKPCASRLENPRPPSQPSIRFCTSSLGDTGDTGTPRSRRYGNRRNEPSRCCTQPHRLRRIAHQRV